MERRRAQNSGPSKATTGAVEMPRAQKSRQPAAEPVHPIGATGAPALLSLARNLVAIAAFFAELAAHAAAAGAGFVRPGDMRSGALLLKSENDGYVEAPRRRHRRRSHGVAARPSRARVTQIFHNPTRRLGRGGLRLSAAGRRRGRHAEDGDRRAHHRRRDQGAPSRRAQIYEQAKAAGQKAALIEQERPNIFTNSVANIGPGETVLVQIEYQEPVRQSGGDVLAAHAAGGRRRATIPSRSCRPSISASGGQGWGRTDRSGARSRPHLAAGARSARSMRRSIRSPITVRLQAGFPLGEVKSHHHAVKIEQPIAGDTRVDQARRRPGAGRPRLRADLAAGRRARRRRSACSASASATPTICSPS